MRVIVSSTRPHPRPTPPASAAAGAGPVTIRPAQIGDLSSSAHLHLDALPVGLFPQLGYRFLRRWHHSFPDHPYAVAFVAVDADRNVLGFLLGTLDHRTHLSHMVRDRQTMASLAVHGIIALVARPQLAARFLRTRALPWCNAAKELFLGCPRDVRTTTSPPRPPADPVAVLAAVAVDPARRGRGIGAELTAGFEAAATQFGTPTAELATHVDTADSASSTSHGFYERLGWTPTRTYLDRDGRRMQVYRRSLGVAAQDGTELT